MKVNNHTYMVFCNCFTEGTACDSVFASVDKKVLLKCSLCLKEMERVVVRGANSFLLRADPIKKGGKKKMVELISLNVQAIILSEKKKYLCN